MSGTGKRYSRASVTVPAFRTVKLGAALLLGLAAALPAAADPAGTQVFSSLCSAAGGGDISGLRIKIAGAPPDVTVTFEETEGALMASTETKDVRYAADTGALAFTLKTEGGTVGFRGQVAPTLLSGTLTREGADPEEIRVPSDKGGDGEGPCSPTGEPVKP